MQIPEEKLLELQAIYKRELGKDITLAEARETGLSALLLIKAIYKPMIYEEYRNILRYRQSIGSYLTQEELEELD